MEPIPSSPTSGPSSFFRRPASTTSVFPRPRPNAFGPVRPASLTSDATRGAADARPRADARATGDREALERRCRSSARWFFWVAALSVVNSAATVAGQPWRFVIGLAITQLSDGLALHAAYGIAMVAVVDAVVLGALALLGRFAHRGRPWAFVAGAVFYALDGLIFVVAGEWIGAAFHALVVVIALRGLAAARRLR